MLDRFDGSSLLDTGASRMATRRIVAVARPACVRAAEVAVAEEVFEEFSASDSLFIFEADDDSDRIAFGSDSRANIVCTRYRSQNAAYLQRFEYWLSKNCETFVRRLPYALSAVRLTELIKEFVKRKGGAAIVSQRFFLGWAAAAAYVTHCAEGQPCLAYEYAFAAEKTMSLFLGKYVRTWTEVTAAGDWQPPTLIDQARGLLARMRQLWSRFPALKAEPFVSKLRYGSTAANTRSAPKRQRRSRQPTEHKQIASHEIDCDDLFATQDCDCSTQAPLSDMVDLFAADGPASDDLIPPVLDEPAAEKTKDAIETGNDIQFENVANESDIEQEPFDCDALFADFGSEHNSGLLIPADPHSEQEPEEADLFSLLWQVEDPASSSLLAGGEAPPLSSRAAHVFALWESQLERLNETLSTQLAHRPACPAHGALAAVFAAAKLSGRIIPRSFADYEGWARVFGFSGSHLRAGTVALVAAASRKS